MQSSRSLFELGRLLGSAGPRRQQCRALGTPKPGGSGVTAMAPALVSAFAAVLAIRPAAAGVGFATVDIPDAGNPPIHAGIWYPTEAASAPHEFGPLTQTVAPDAPLAGSRLPLVVLSHGSGGWYGGHLDTALALAEAGFVVAAPTHPGDNFRDQSRMVSGLPDRPRQLETVIDYVLGPWPGHDRLDPQRIGLFGFSAGGFTGLVLVGGKPDLAAVEPYCRSHAAVFACTALSGAEAAGFKPQPVPATAWMRDPRIKAAVIAAPALGFAFGRDGLTEVTAPIQLWKAAEDHILPAPDYADAVARDLPKPPEFHTVPGADHFDFLTPCSAELQRDAPMICSETGGFDRTAFHQRFDAELVRFLKQSLGP